MAKFIIVQNLKTLRRGPNKGLEDEVVFLHKLLNYHLPPPDDPLPMVGPEASAFGPRTEAKVKKFQEVNRIDFGTRDFKDGVVGRHTWKVLTEPFMMTSIILAAPQLRLNPPTFPPNLQIPPPPKPILIPVPKLTLPTIQVQSGASFTFDTASGDTSVANSFQITAFLLKRKDGIIREVQTGPVIVDTPSGRTDRTDIGILASISTGDLPGSGNVVSYSIQQQDALLKSVTDRAGSVQSFNLIELDILLFKKKDVVNIKATGQGGVVFELDSPGRDNNRKWEGKVGVGGFLGVTVTFGEHEDKK
jgi:hypothetical protein